MCSGRRGAPARPSTAGGRIVAHSPDAVVRPKEPSLVGAFLFRWFDDPCVEPPRASTRVWVSSASARRKSTVRKTLTSDRVLSFRHPSSSKLNSLQLPSGVWIPADFLPVGWRDTVDDAPWRLTSAGDIQRPAGLWWEEHAESAVSAKIGLDRIPSPFSTRNQPARNGNRGSVEALGWPPRCVGVV